ncbi:hypothetical protein [Saccharopolyspora cebuensis]|uniref:hypothetical protein n=1 Tax=Saccharopolyspora cebuensis TaxID=418759 RepID=UPI0031EB1679
MSSLIVPPVIRVVAWEGLEVSLGESVGCGTCRRGEGLRLVVAGEHLVAVWCARGHLTALPERTTAEVLAAVPEQDWARVELGCDGTVPDMAEQAWPGLAAVVGEVGYHWLRSTYGAPRSDPPPAAEEQDEHDELREQLAVLLRDRTTAAAGHADSVLLLPVTGRELELLLEVLLDEDGPPGQRMLAGDLLARADDLPQTQDASPERLRDLVRRHSTGIQRLLRAGSHTRPGGW